MNTNNKINVKEQALAGQRVIKVINNGVAEYHPVGLSSLNPNSGAGGITLPDGITVTPADVKDGIFYIDSTGAKAEGTMTNHGTVDVTLAADSQTLDAGYYDAINIPASSGGDIVLPTGITVTPANVLDGIFYIDADGNKAEGEMVNHGDVSVALSSSEQTLDAGYYNSVVIPASGGGGGTSSIEFYECASYDNGETTPAHSNINISGLTSPAETNGTYVLQDFTSTGTDRVWAQGDYCIAEKGGFWYIYNKADTPNAMTSLFYAPVAFATTGEGTADNPIYWDDAITDTANRWITPTFSTGDYSSSNYRRNFYVKLVAGTPYSMGITNPDGTDNIITLYNLNGTSVASDDDGGVEVNGTSCSDGFTYTPSTSGLYRLEAGALGQATGNVQVCCYPAPEEVHAPTATEPWEIEWTLGGAEEGAYVVTNAGLPAAIGIYTPSTETFDGNTVWTNVDTGTVFKASFSGSSWRWCWYESATATTFKYREQDYKTNTTPWDAADTTWTINNAARPTPVFARGTGQATGTLATARTDVAERPATGKQVWTGYRATQNTDNLKWSISQTETVGLTASGFEPVVGRIYSADTTIMVAAMDMQADGKMVCLAHFDFPAAAGKSIAFTDSTETCIVQIQNQASINTDIVKFGSGSWGGNYRNPPYEGGFSIIGLPEIAGDFTVEFWHYFSGYDEFGGTILYTYIADDYGGAEDGSVVELRGIELASTHPLLSKKIWFHRAFVREGTIVTEYINGHKVATSEFSVALGGSRQLVVYGGGTNVGDVRNYIDEFAIFNYAKYTKDFTPPFVSYEDVKSGLRDDSSVREVAVSGVKSITFANSKSYALINPDATGTDRIWANATGEWFIVYENGWDYTWQIANSRYWDDAGRVVAAYIPNDDTIDMSAVEPIDNTNWVDYYDDTVKVKVESLSEPGSSTQVPQLWLSGAGIEGVDGKYTYNSSPTAITFPTAGGIAATSAGYIGGQYCIHNIKSIDPVVTTLNVWYVAPLANPQNIIYYIANQDLYFANKRWSIVEGITDAEPAPYTRLTGED